MSRPNDCCRWIAWNLEKGQMRWSHTVFAIFSKLSAKSNSSILGLPFDKVEQIRSSFAKFKLQFRPSFPIVALYQIISNTTFQKSKALVGFQKLIIFSNLGSSIVDLNGNDKNSHKNFLWQNSQFEWSERV